MQSCERTVMTGFNLHCLITVFASGVIITPIFNCVLKVGVPKGVRQTVCKLVECGFLFNKVRKYIDARSADSAAGLVGQVTALRLIAAQKLHVIRI